MFETLKDKVSARFEQMQANGATLFDTSVNRDKIWEAYYNAFPEGEQQEHNCNCCKAFIRQAGGVVTIDPVTFEIGTIWDVEDIPAHYEPSVAALRDYVKRCAIVGLYYHENLQVGTDKSPDPKRQVVWRHFMVKLPKAIQDKDGSMLRKSADLREARGVFRRALEEFKIEDVATVLELVDQGSLYRGNEDRHTLLGWHGALAEYKALPEGQRENWLWLEATKRQPAFLKARNSTIGELMIALSEGKSLDAAVGAYEKMKAPANYKRPTALVTPRMIDEAKKTLEGLNLLSALDRRRLDNRDLSAANALFVYRPVASAKDVFSELKGAAPVNVKTLDKVEEISINDFVEKVLPKAKSLRVLFENQHLTKLMTLTGPQDPDAKNMMKWDNSFGWSYTGGVADSLRERVSNLGGRVDGVLRFSHTWNYDGLNQSLMDLHVFMPGYIRRDSSAAEVHDHYPSSRRVGWNKRNDPSSGGVQDVDFTQPPGKEVPVENITFPSVAKMPEGVYTFKIHNWALRQPTKSGFQAEIECGGEVHQYHYPKALGHKEWITLAEVTLKAGVFTINHILQPATAAQTKWGITTGTWRQVNAITLSPNYWTKPTGNKQWYFLLEGCVSDEKTRPFYNEFLCDELSKDRKTMEILGSKIEVLPAAGAELSGLGFSETTRSSLYVEVEGTFRRVVKLMF